MICLRFGHTLFFPLTDGFGFTQSFFLKGRFLIVDYNDTSGLPSPTTSSVVVLCPPSLGVALESAPKTSPSCLFLKSANALTHSHSHTSPCSHSNFKVCDQLETATSHKKPLYCNTTAVSSTRSVVPTESARQLQQTGFHGVHWCNTHHCSPGIC